MNHLYVINGYPGSGKTFFGQVFGEELKPQGVNFAHLSSIDPVKMILLPEDKWDATIIPSDSWEEMHIIKRIYTPEDWDGQTKDDYWRRIMFEVKAHLGKHRNGFIEEWLLARASQIESPRIIFVDIREEENIKFFREYCTEHSPEISFGTIFINSDCGSPSDNGADRTLNPKFYDYVIDNNRKGLFESDAAQALREQVRTFLISIQTEGG